MDNRTAAQADLAAFESEREAFAEGLDEKYRRVYDNLIRGGRRVAVAPMTEDGACGACFSVIPLQVQHEIRATGRLVLCESCGVIVTAPIPEEDLPEPLASDEVEEESAAGEEGAAEEGADAEETSGGEEE